MTREEQITFEADKYTDTRNNYVEWGNGWEDFDDKEYIEKEFQAGAKWADENPKRYSQEELCDIQLEMMKQRDKRLLDKVIKVLKNNIDLWTNTRQSIFSNYREVYFLDNFEEDFRKAMEE